MRIPRLFALVFIPVGLAAGAVAFARGPHGDAHGPHGNGGLGPSARFLQMVAGLDLNADQQAKVSAIRAAAREEMRAGIEAHVADGDALVGAVRAGQLTREAVHAKVAERAAEREQRAHAIADDLFDLYETLSPAQRAALADEMEERLAHAEERLDAGAPGAGGPRKGGR
jgi:Spy/CpxP family protein refolding chaperone